MMQAVKRVPTLALTLVVVVALAAGTAVAQPTMSIDFQGPTLGAPDGFWGMPIGSGDILSSPFPGPPIGSPAPGPLLPPGKVVDGMLPPPPVRSLGLMPGNGPTPEVDALSYGRDLLPPLNEPGGGAFGNYIFFSVDEFAMGHPGVPAFPPNVLTEGITGAAEASADVFMDIGSLMSMIPLPPLAAPPLSPPAGNTAVLDGDGLMPTGLPGFGLIEPNPPIPGGPFDLGDNLDALDMDTTRADIAGPIFFSLDSAFPDPLEGPPANSGTAMANFDVFTGNTFVGGDVVVNVQGLGNVLYAAAGALGLDIIGGPDSDDLDALVLLDDGRMMTDPATGATYPFYNPNTDQLAFSVRRGSVLTFALAGMPDSIWNVPIEEGDILVPPVLGGVSPFPGIIVPAEWLGLHTMRSGVPGQWAPFSDDLDALDVAVPEPSTFVLAAMGLACLLGYVRRRKRA